MELIYRNNSQDLIEIVRIYLWIRHIGDNIRLLFDVIDLTAANEIPGSIFTADICKAFDSLNWDFMLRVVEKYCFGSTVLKWIKTFYTMPICKIASSNLLSEKFLIGRGVRQGDPLSPTLFILFIECLANILRDSHLFNGLKIGDLSVKVSMFADDTLIFLNGLETSLNMSSIFFKRLVEFRVVDLI